MQPAAAAKRIYFLDNLKSAVIVLVILHHAAIAFMSAALPGWGIHDVRTSAVFDWLVAWDDTFIMPLMFFVSGYFALGSAVKYSAAQFLKGKWFRIGWPWLIGILFLAPVTWHVSHSGFGNWGELFDWRARLQFFYPAQYWYLNLLLWFYLLALALYKWQPRFFQRRAAPVLPERWQLWAFACACFLGMVALNLFMPDGQWSASPLLTCQWVRVPLYFGFFLLGVWAWRNHWFAPEGYLPAWKPWTLAAVVCSLGYIGVRAYFHFTGLALPAPWAILADQGLRVLLCMVCAFAAIALFQRYADSASPVWKRLSASAFAVYWIQQPVVNIVAQLVREWEMNCALKFALVSLATMAISFWLAETLLLKLPFFAPEQKKAAPVSVQNSAV